MSFRVWECSVASRRQDHDGVEEQEHLKRNAVAQTARAAEGLHAGGNVEERESDRDNERGNRLIAERLRTT